MLRWHRPTEAQSKLTGGARIVCSQIEDHLIAFVPDVSVRGFGWVQVYSKDSTDGAFKLLHSERLMVHSLPDAKRQAVDALCVWFTKAHSRLKDLEIKVENFRKFIPVLIKAAC